MKTSKSGHRRKAERRTGFTLVEMLVSVTLVLLMMTMFASIFSIATDSVSKQRGIAENDQRARSLATVIRSDVQHRTLRYPLAYYPSENSATSPTSFGNRSGYLYISTNHSASGLDDVVQFTVSSLILIENTADTPYFGAAQLLHDRLATGASPTGITFSPNQPEADDSSLDLNSTANSPAAEVVYFIRKGNLYRRVSLIRNPLSLAGRDLGPQPTSSSGYDFLSGQPDPGDASTYDGKFTGPGIFVGGSNLSNDFWRFFDFSAVPSLPINGLQSARLLGISSLSNESLGAVSEALGKPSFRFGFNRLTGLSREHTNSVAPQLFIGRFLHAETSATNFNWPQNISVREGTDESTPGNITAGVLQNADDGTDSTGNPFDIRGARLSLNPGNGLVTQFDEQIGSEGRGGVRRVEDLLLPNVHEMRVEIWDEKLQRFVTPGHFSSTVVGGVTVLGDYHQRRNMNNAYGPLSSLSGGTVFDTWHPDAQVDLNFDGTSDPDSNPPYIAYDYYPPRTNDSPSGPSPASMPSPGAERPNNEGFWRAQTDYSLGEVVFLPRNDWANTTPPPFNYSLIAEPKFQIAYRCVVNSGTSAAAPPVAWPKVPGRTVTDGTVVWESFDNRLPLQSMRMTLRFLDQTTDTMRQLSLILSLTDKSVN